MRKKTAFIFVLLANLVFLAHAVIPHHHHSDNKIAFSFECSENEEHDHDESLLLFNGEHKGHETEICSIFQTFFIPNNLIKVIEISSEIEPSQKLLNLVLVSGFLSQDVFVDKSRIIKGFVPIFSHFLLVSSQGLRAPPVC